jgi:DNA-binding transcriptional LysR family regulator
MTLDQLRYFLETARLEHVGRASRSLAISPSAVSAAIAALEDELGTRFFDRVGKSIALNADGRKLQAHAQSLLGHLSSMKSDFAQGTAFRGTYRLGASPFLAARVLAPAWSELQHKHPELIGDLRSMRTHDVLQGVLSGTLDFGLCFSPLPQPGLALTVLRKGPLVVAVRKGHPLARLSASSWLKRLSGFPAALHKAAAGVDLCETHPIFERYGIRPQVSLLFDHDEVAVQSLRRSDAWALLPDLVARSAGADLVALRAPAGWDASYSIACVAREKRAEDGVVAALSAAAGLACKGNIRN